MKMTVEQVNSAGEVTGQSMMLTVMGGVGTTESERVQIEANSSHRQTTGQNAHSETPASIGADPAGSAEAAVTAHEQAADPHSQYDTGTEVQARVNAHANLTDNPHGVTAAQVGLGQVDNTSDADKPVSTAQQTALDGKADLVGGTVPSSQLPGFVDDVLEYADAASFPATGEAGKIYVALDTGNIYRWATTVYVEISDSLDATEVKSLYESNADTNAYTDAEKAKLAAVESGAEVNNISDTNATDLTDAGDTSLHYHSSDRDRSNHTGTQTSDTISDFDTAVQAAETVTSLSLATNILTYVDENGVSHEIDLSLYLDDTNLARLTSGTLDGSTGIATFTRDDASTFTVDFSALLDDTRVPVIDNLTSTETTSALSANQGRVLDDKIGAMLEYPSIRPSLLLDFYSKEIDPRITFSRASTATYTDNTGRMAYADINEPRIDHDKDGVVKGLLIEESKTNLLKYSRDFDNAAWVKVGVTVTPNVLTAPDGTLTASRISKSSEYSYILELLTLGLTDHCGSVYCKAGTNNVVSLGLTENGTSTILVRGAVDLTTGVVTNSRGTITTNYVGNGWWRIYSTVLFTNSSVGLLIYPGIFSDSTTGDVYIWGAQLEEGSSPSSYTPSTDTFTSRASTATYFDADGVMQTAAIDEARYTYNPADLTAPATLLLEHTAATNLSIYSQTSAQWTLSSCSIDSTFDFIDGTTQDVFLASDVAASHRLVGSAPSSIPADTVCTYGWYVYVPSGSDVAALFMRLRSSSGEGQAVRVEVTGTGSSAEFSFSVSLPFGTNAPPVVTSSDMFSEYVGGGIHRVSIRSAASSVSTGNIASSDISFSTGLSETEASTANTKIGITGFSVEVGNYPTSYIPTTSAPVTRAADISTSTATTRAADVAYIDGTDFSDFYNQNEGTVVVGGKYSSGNTALTVGDLSITSDSDDYKLYVQKYTTNQNATQIELQDGYTRRIEYFPKALTDNNLIALTTEE
jgi:hypothetical protein